MPHKKSAAAGGAGRLIKYNFQKGQIESLWPLDVLYNSYLAGQYAFYCLHNVARA